MEQRNNLVLQGTETFSRGQLDNVALDGGALVLDSVAGRCLQYGSYTTPEFAMPAFCNLNVSWNAFAPHNTMVEVRCRVYAGGNWTGWMSFGKWAPGYPRCSCNSQSDDGMIFLMGDTVTVATPGGGTGVQLQVNLSTNDDKVSPAVRLLAAAVRPLAWEKHNGHPLNRQLYLPEYCLAAHDPSFGRTMDLPLVMAALMNCWGEDVLPEEVAYVMEDMAHSTTANAAFAAAAAGCCGYPCWQAWMDLADLRAQIHDDCCVAVQVERRIRGQRDPVRRNGRLCAAERPHRRFQRRSELHHGTGGLYALLYRARHRPAGKTPRCCRQPSAADALRAGARRDGRRLLF